VIALLAAAALWAGQLGPTDEALRARILEVSERFVGTPYLESPLGEGEGEDPDPLIRFDAVDCLTFVEQVLALAMADNPAEVLPLLLRLRYAQAPSYQGRNHLMEAQWIPHNQHKGFIRDVTAEWGGGRTVPWEKELTVRTWRSPSSRALGLTEPIIGRYGYQLVPLGALREVAQKVPAGTILVVVREDRPTRVSRITHLGFVVRRGQQTYLRHAARSVFRRVIDEDLDAFLRRNARYDKWPVAGAMLLAPGGEGGALVQATRP
jgi:hypothetical protein